MPHRSSANPPELKASVMARLDEQEKRLDEICPQSDPNANERLAAPTATRRKLDPLHRGQWRNGIKREMAQRRKGIGSLPRKGSRPPPPRKGCRHRSAPPCPSHTPRRACLHHRQWRLGKEETMSPGRQMDTEAHARLHLHRPQPVGPDMCDGDDFAT